MSATVTSHPGHAASRRTARLVLFSFVLTFIAARLVVLLIMARLIPDLYLHLAGTHVHHLNFGIILLAAVGAYLLFARPRGTWRSAAAVVYGIGLALTFDEFGMWLHLGGSYWQRASFDAVVLIAALLTLLAYAPRWNRMRRRHWAAVVLLALAATLFGIMLVRSTAWAAQRLAPRMHRFETTAPS
jgi:hypothetical protein